MQTQNNAHRRGTLDMLSGLRVQREAGKRLAILAGLCLVLPPVGLVCLWRSRHTGTPVRVALSVMSLLMVVLPARLRCRRVLLPLLSKLPLRFRHVTVLQ